MANLGKMKRLPISNQKLARITVEQGWIGSCAACLFGYFHWPIVKAQPLLFPAVALFFSGGYLISKVGFRQKALITAGLQLLLAGILSVKTHLTFNFVLIFLSAVLAFLYNGFGLSFRFRENLWLKNFTIGIIWALLIFSVKNGEMSFWHFPAVAFFIFGVLIGYDIRDAARDKITTLPRKFGNRKAILIAAIALIFSLISIILSGSVSWLPWLLTVLAALFFIQTANNAKPGYYFSIFGEFLCALPLFFSLALPKFTLCF